MAPNHCPHHGHFSRMKLLFCSTLAVYIPGGLCCTCDGTGSTEQCISQSCCGLSCGSFFQEFKTATSVPPPIPWPAPSENPVGTNQFAKTGTSTKAPSENPVTMAAQDDLSLISDLMVPLGHSASNLLILEEDASIQSLAGITHADEVGGQRVEHVLEGPGKSQKKRSNQKNDVQKEAEFASLELNQAGAFTVGSRMTPIVLLVLLFLLVMGMALCLITVTRQLETYDESQQCTKEDTHQMQPRVASRRDVAIGTSAQSTRALEESAPQPPQPGRGSRGSPIIPGTSLSMTRSSQGNPDITPPPSKQNDFGDCSTLCADIMIPEQHECVLMMPMLPLPSSNTRNAMDSNGPRTSTNVTLMIKDTHGKPSFRLAVNLAPRVIGDRLTLGSVLGEYIYGRAKDGPDGSSLIICECSGAEFGELRQLEGNDFTLTKARGQEVHFHMSAQGNNVKAIDYKGWPLAVSERGPDGISSDRRVVRIGPMVDAAMILVCLLGIDLLKAGVCAKS